MSAGVRRTRQALAIFRTQRISRSLTVLLLAVALFGIAWALLTPAWQTPDEPYQFQYVQDLVENHSLPRLKGSTYSSATGFAMYVPGTAEGIAYTPAEVAPNWSPAASSMYRKLEASNGPSAANGGGPNPATNPPFYYAFASVAYWLDSGGTTIGQLYAIRLEGVLLLLITTAAVWLLAGEVFGKRRLLQLVAAAVAGLLPMTTFMSAAVNPDAMVITLSSVALWLAVKLVRRHGSTGDAAALGLVTAAAILTKATCYFLVVPSTLALVGALWLAPREQRRAALKALGVFLGCMAIPVVCWLVVANINHYTAVNQVIRQPGSIGLSVGGFLSYLWEFYLPHLPGMTIWNEAPPPPSNAFWLGEALGSFGWLEIVLPAWVYDVAKCVVGLLAPVLTLIASRSGSSRRTTAIVGTAVVAFLALLLRQKPDYLVTLPFLALLAVLAFAVVDARKPERRERSVVILVLGVACVALLALLHASDYLSLAYGDNHILQGRYLLPVAGVIGLCAAAVVAKTPVRARELVGGVTLLAMFALQILSLSAVLVAYYV